MLRILIWAFLWFGLLLFLTQDVEAHRVKRDTCLHKAFVFADSYEEGRKAFRVCWRDGRKHNRLGHLKWSRAAASAYGPGLYGNRTACGQTLRSSTVGIAHRSWPCGTRVVFRVGKRRVVARVIDRGPFIGGRSFDLTAATVGRLGYQSARAWGVRRVSYARSR